MKKPLNIIIILAISFAIISISMNASHVAGSTPKSCFFDDNAAYVEDLQNKNTTSMLPGSPTSLTLTYCGDDKMCYKGDCVAKGCYDADNNAGRGKSFYIKGYAAYKKSIKKSYYGHAIDKCSRKTLYEGICTYGKAQYITHTCSLGCTNNACEKECKPIYSNEWEIIGQQDYDPNKGWTKHYNGCSGNNVVTWSCHYNSTRGRYTAVPSSTTCSIGCSKGKCEHTCSAYCSNSYNGLYPDYIIHGVDYRIKHNTISWCFTSRKSNVCKENSLVAYYCDGTDYKTKTVDCPNGCSSHGDYFSGETGFCNPRCQDIINVNEYYKRYYIYWWRENSGIGIIIHDGKKDTETYYNHCIKGENAYIKYYCSGDPPSTKNHTETVTCKQGYHCSNGECVTNNRPGPGPTNSYTCTKSDEYKNNPTRPNPGKAGITQLRKNSNGIIKETEKDSCNKNILTEYYCPANSKLDSIPYEKIDCSKLYTNGICQTGSDGGYCSGS